MPTVEVRRLTGPAMIEPFMDLTRYAFEPSPPLADEKDWRKLMESLSESQTAVVTVDGQPVASAASAPMTQNVRGKIVPMSGLWGVATHPLHRFQGYARQAVAEVLTAAREAGTPVATLYPFRESWYEKLGYVSWPQPRTAIIKAANLKPFTELAVDGELELLKMSEGHADYQRFLEARQQVVHGMAGGDHKAYTYSANKDRVWLVLARIEGEIVGALTYKLKGSDDDIWELTVYRFTYSTVPGRTLLLNFLARHIDQVKTVKISLPPFEQPETWHSDLFVELEAAESPMGRILDIAGLKGLAVGPGSFSARLTDPLCPWNEGIYQFSSGNGLLDVTPADDPDCALNSQALSALVYGVRDPAEFAIRGWGDPGSDHQQIMRTMFPPQFPWLHLEF